MQDTAGHACQQRTCMVKLRHCHSFNSFGTDAVIDVPVDAAYGLYSPVHTVNCLTDAWHHGHSSIKVCPKIAHQVAQVYGCICYPQGSLQLINHAPYTCVHCGVVSKARDVGLRGLGYGSWLPRCSTVSLVGPFTCICTFSTQ